MAIVQQNQWFPNALRTEPGQTIYGATPWQTMQQAYQQPQNMLASNATVGQPIAQQPYQSPTVRTLPDLAPVQSTVRPPGTMPTMPQPATNGPVAVPDMGASTLGASTGMGELWPNMAPVPRPDRKPPEGFRWVQRADGWRLIQVNPAVAPTGYHYVWGTNYGDAITDISDYWASFDWLLEPDATDPNVVDPGTGGGKTVPPPTDPNVVDPIPGTGGKTIPGPTPTGPQPYSWGDPRYGRLDAPVWDWSQGPPRQDTPGGFWLKSPWAERWGNQNNPADTVYVPEGMTFGDFLAANPWYYNAAGPSDEVVTDGVLRAMLAKLLDEINVRASDQYKYRPGAVGAQQIVNMNPSEKEMLMGKWQAMGLSGDDMWQMMLRAMPKGNAQTMTRWG